MFLITNCEDNSDTLILNDYFGFNEQSEHSPTPLEAETTTPAERMRLRLSTLESDSETPTSIIIPLVTVC